MYDSLEGNRCGEDRVPYAQVSVNPSVWTPRGEGGACRTALVGHPCSLPKCYGPDKRGGFWSRIAASRIDGGEGVYSTYLRVKENEKSKVEFCDDTF